MRGQARSRGGVQGEEWPGPEKWCILPAEKLPPEHFFGFREAKVVLTFDYRAQRGFEYAREARNVLITREARKRRREDT